MALVMGGAAAVAWWLGWVQLERETLGLPKWNGSISSLILIPPRHLISPFSKKKLPLGYATRANVSSYDLQPSSNSTLTFLGKMVWLIIMMAMVVWNLHMLITEPYQDRLKEQKASSNRQILLLEEQIDEQKKEIESLTVQIQCFKNNEKDIVDQIALYIAAHEERAIDATRTILDLENQLCDKAKELTALKNPDSAALVAVADADDAVKDLAQELGGVGTQAQIAGDKVKSLEAEIDRPLSVIRDLKVDVQSLQPRLGEKTFEANQPANKTRDLDLKLEAAGSRAKDTEAAARKAGFDGLVGSSRSSFTETHTQQPPVMTHPGEQSGTLIQETRSLAKPGVLQAGSTNGSTHCQPIPEKNFPKQRAVAPESATKSDTDTKTGVHEAPRKDRSEGNEPKTRTHRHDTALQEFASGGEAASEGDQTDGKSLPAVTNGTSIGHSATTATAMDSRSGSQEHRYPDEINRFQPPSHHLPPILRRTWQRLSRSRRHLTRATKTES